ncbi:hypothetical protein PV325_003412 [Microctonus aethiopoides]|nr:hypothetical protein PV325_003412 [Microctonus aethiopoides]
MSIIIPWQSITAKNTLYNAQNSRVKILRYILHQTQSAAILVDPYQNIRRHLYIDTESLKYHKDTIINRLISQKLPKALQSTMLMALVLPQQEGNILKSKFNKKTVDFPP